jgi:uncharacterized protein
MTPDMILLAVLIFGAAVLYSSVGHAGASGYLAVMALFSLVPDVMKPTALVLNVCVASLGVWRYTRAGQTDLKVLWPLIVGSIPAAFLGAKLNVPPEWYRPLLGGVLLVSALHFAWTSGRAAAQDAIAHRPQVLILIGTGVAIGLLSGMTGTGGGVFLSPLLLWFGWTATRPASGVAATFILVNSVSGLAGLGAGISHLPALWPVFAVAAVGGGLIGTQLGTRTLPIPGLRLALSGVLVIAALKLILA